MAHTTKDVQVYTETGQKRTFAGVLDWPGWCRSDRDEAAALQTLFDYLPRYARVLKAAGITFAEPDSADFKIVERLKGDATTDFGAPGFPPAYDAAPTDAALLKHLQAILRACWAAFDRAADAADGKDLRKGPRGGGRDLGKIVRHVHESQHGYLGKLPWKRQKPQGGNLAEEIAHQRDEVIAALEEASKEGAPIYGPRGGLLWTPRYFVRREAWHVLDHTWEIEDRVIDS